MVTESTLNNNISKKNEPMNEENDKDNPGSKNNGKVKILVYFAIIIVLTGIALFFSLKDDFNGIVNAIKHADWKWVLVIIGIVFLSYGIDAFTIFIFSRLYTRRYKYHQGYATSMIGAFYSGITPGASGGQIMEVYTMKKQGIEVSTAASIMVMSYIVYQICLILVGAVGLFFNGGLVASVGNFIINIGGNKISIPSIPLTIAGFLLNIFVILILFLMSYSHKFHNFILHYGIGFLGKIHILKKPDKTRESLRIQVENFKIELRRLCANIPIFILMIICFTLILILRFSIPFFAGLALNGYGTCLNPDGSLNIISGTNQALQSIGQPDVQSFFQCVFLSSFHQMATGLIPIPGAAGVSEYFFNTIFANFYISQQVTTAAQILWRFSTFHVVLLISGIITATYRSSPKDDSHEANRKTFVTLQYQTFNERKVSSDTMFETSSLSRKEIQSRLKELKIRKSSKNKPVANNNEVPSSTNKPINQKKNIKKSKKNEVKDTIDTSIWDTIETGDD